MTQAEYEARLRAMEQQLQADIALLQAAHAVRVRSLEGLRQEAQEGDRSTPVSPVLVQAAAAPPPAPKRKHTRPRGTVREDVAAILPRLPQTFDRSDVDRLLGYRPTRPTLFRTLLALESEGMIEVVQHSMGGQRAQYRKSNPSR